VKSAKIGRNDPCPCGSGKKWKKCHGGPTEADEQTPSFEELLAAFGSAGDLQIREVVPELKSLTEELADYDPIPIISAAAALSSLAENHTLIFRLDTLILLAATYCTGKQKPSREVLDRWLNTEIPESQVKRMEDPAEDFAVGLVRTAEGNRLILNGHQSGPDAYLQDVLDTLEAAPPELVSIRSKIKTILALSNELVGRRCYDRSTGSAGVHESVTLPNSEGALWRLVITQTFTAADLPSIDRFEAEIRPFVLTLEELSSGALDSRIVQSRSKILLNIGGAYLLIFPTAVADSIISYSLREVARLNMIRGFNNALNRRQAGRIFKDAVRHFGRENRVTKEGDLDGNSRPPGLSEMAFRFDHNRYFHLVILHDDITEVLSEGLDATRRPVPGVADYIGRISSVLAQRSGCVGGFTLIVMVGVGRPYQVATPNTLPSGWSLQVWSLFDFEHLQWLERDWEGMLWKISQQREILSARQIEFVSPDDATLYASWMNEEYRLIPREAIEPGQVLVNVSCGEVFSLREKARHRLDNHAAYRPDFQTWVTICRINPLTYFKEDLLRQRYGAPNLAAQNLLAGAVENKNRTWWLDCSLSRYPDADRGYMFKVWETALIWLERVVTVAEEQLLWEPQRNPIITLDLSAIASMKHWDPSAMQGVTPVNTFMVELDEYGFTVTIPAAFVSMGRSPQNVAELLLAKAFVSGASLLAGKPLSDSEIEKVIEPLHISPDERHMHTLMTTDHRDHLREFGEREFKLLKDADVYFADAGIGYEAGINQPTLIDANQ
jgi:SEC-C motif-containing protein